ncbi:MAG: hypothetical protein OEM97_08465 [Acidimicrobiia bacterium]|nr:hypothetical protein [Acidimicrobiia bacterium]
MIRGAGTPPASVQPSLIVPAVAGGATCRDADGGMLMAAGNPAENIRFRRVNLYVS